MNSKLIIVTKKNIEEANNEELSYTDEYYTLNKQQLFLWLKNNKSFTSAYYRWVESGYKLGYTPCIYFLDDMEGATLKNMRITIWKYYKKTHLDRDYSYTDLRILTVYEGKYIGCDNLGLWSTYKQMGLMREGMESNSHYDSDYEGSGE